jgi:hypothetical protein
MARGRFPIFIILKTHLPCGGRTGVSTDERFRRKGNERALTLEGYRRHCRRASVYLGRTGSQPTMAMDCREGLRSIFESEF